MDFERWTIPSHQVISKATWESICLNTHGLDTAKIALEIAHYNRVPGTEILYVPSTYFKPVLGGDIYNFGFECDEYAIVGQYAAHISGLINDHSTVDIFPICRTQEEANQIHTNWINEILTIKGPTTDSNRTTKYDTDSTHVTWSDAPVSVRFHYAWFKSIDELVKWMGPGSKKVVFDGSSTWLTLDAALVYYYNSMLVDYRIDPYPWNSDNFVHTFVFDYWFMYFRGVLKTVFPKEYIRGPNPYHHTIGWSIWLYIDHDYRESFDLDKFGEHQIDGYVIDQTLSVFSECYCNDTEPCIEGYYPAMFDASSSVELPNQISLLQDSEYIREACIDPNTFDNIDKMLERRKERHKQLTACGKNLRIPITNNEDEELDQFVDYCIKWDKQLLPQFTAQINPFNPLTRYPATSDSFWGKNLMPDLGLRFVAWTEMRVLLMIAKRGGTILTCVPKDIWKMLRRWFMFAHICGGQIPAKFTLQ